jgi:ABC-type branched-subunit amino acid transport system ATPase component
MTVMRDYHRTDSLSHQSGLDAEGIDATYGRLQATFNVRICVRPGETVALLGRNGAGKTSTLKALAGTISSRTKKLTIDGVDVTRMPTHERVRRGLALVNSGSRGFPRLTVLENLRVVRTPSDRPSEWTVDGVLDEFPQLKEILTRRAGNLSGGERQMLAIGRALLTSPTILMLDEPTEGLAPKVLELLAARIRNLNERGVGVLLTEQSHSFALGVAQRAAFLQSGRADVGGEYLGV